MFCAKRAKKGLVRIPIGIVPVHSLAAYRPFGRLYVLRVANGKTPNLLETGIEFVELLPGYATPHLPDGLLLVVVPGIPALDLRRILERHDLSKHTGNHTCYRKRYEQLFHRLSTFDFPIQLSILEIHVFRHMLATASGIAGDNFTCHIRRIVRCEKRNDIRDV